jgi:hypothetical protein
MGIDFAQYFNDDSSYELADRFGNVPSPLASEDSNWLLVPISQSTFGWPNMSDFQVITDHAIDDTEDIDTLIQAASTSIEAQSSQTEIAN